MHDPQRSLMLPLLFPDPSVFFYATFSDFMSRSTDIFPEWQTKSASLANTPMEGEEYYRADGFPFVNGI